MSSDAFYNGVIAEVLPVLQEYGTDFQIRSKGKYDETTGDVLPPSPPRTARGVVSEGFMASELGSDVGGANRGGAWMVGRRQLILEPAARLLATDEVLVDGVWWSCAKLVQVKPANIVVIYIIDLGG